MLSMGIILNHVKVLKSIIQKNVECEKPQKLGVGMEVHRQLDRAYKDPTHT